MKDKTTTKDSTSNDASAMLADSKNYGLRNYFAAMAMQSLIIKSKLDSSLDYDIDQEEVISIAIDSYVIADEMVKQSKGE